MYTDEYSNSHGNEDHQPCGFLWKEYLSSAPHSGQFGYVFTSFLGICQHLLHLNRYFLYLKQMGWQGNTTMKAKFSYLRVKIQRLRNFFFLIQHFKFSYEYMYTVFEYHLRQLSFVCFFNKIAVKLHIFCKKSRGKMKYSNAFSLVIHWRILKFF